MHPFAELATRAADLARTAAAALDEALGVLNEERGAGNRQRHRALLEEALRAIGRAVEAADRERDLSAAARALSLVCRAHAARGKDALHGAVQMAAASQRAPTPEDCDDGWERVAEIVVTAEESAGAAESAAAAIEGMVGAPAERVRAARRGAAEARRFAVEARRVLAERNHAHTFHTDYGFSFGEGWYLAAAAVLGGITLQIEPDQPATPQAEWFLREAGLSARLQPYRVRPRANKPATAVVARAFRDDPSAAQRHLRRAFLGEAPIAPSVRGVADGQLDALRGRAKVLVWVRDTAHQAGRNTAYDEVVALCACAREAGLVPVLVGDALRGGALPEGAIDLLLWWKQPLFLGLDGRRAQLQFFEHLRAAHGVIGQVGVTTAGMDGPALLGMPTLYLTQTSNRRMREWVGAVPGYVEVVRAPDYLDAVRAAFVEWARR